MLCLTKILNVSCLRIGVTKTVGTLTSALKTWENGDEYCDQFVAGAWEGWKAAKRNIIPMNVVEHDCKDIYMNDFGDLVISQGTELYRKLIEE